MRLEDVVNKDGGFDSTQSRAATMVAKVMVDLLLMEVACFRSRDCDRKRLSSGSELLGVVACDLDQGQVAACVVQGKE